MTLKRWRAGAAPWNWIKLLPMSSPEILREIEGQLRARGLDATEDELAELGPVYEALTVWIQRVERLALPEPG
jgi:hypothetical protein